MVSACFARCSYKYNAKKVLNSSPNEHSTERLYINSLSILNDNLKIRNTATIDVENIIKNNSQPVGFNIKILFLYLNRMILTLNKASVFETMIPNNL